MVGVMTINIYSIEGYLLQLLSAKEFDDPLVNGLQIEGTRPIRRIACAVSATLSSIQEACAQQADVLLVHHGITFPQGLPVVKGVVRQRFSELFASGIHLLSFHLPLDAHEEFGNVWPVVRHFGWSNLLPFGNVKGRCIGVKGTIPPTSPTDLFRLFSQYWGTPGEHIGRDPHKKISSCAYISGGGHRFFQEAIDQGIDCFITGTVSNTVWELARESNAHFMSFGHIATERLGVQLLGAHVAQKFGLEWFFIEEPNPY
jgi:dinuclear metal center YbgI/SA1388 family protein